MQKERIRIIDALRGFSLLGILLANVVIYSYGVLDTPNDKVKKFIKILMEGSFMPIFTLLFGYSLIKLVESLKRRNKHIRWHLTRRFQFWLKLITCAQHITVYRKAIWECFC